MNKVIYSIAHEQLQGTVGKESFLMRAWAGGGRGQTGNAADHSAASYDVFRKTQHNKGIHGGPLPPGLYLCTHIAKHAHFGECIFLQAITPFMKIDMNAQIRFCDREGFFIHGRGPHGSDGCIVPELDNERLRLNKAIKNAVGIVLLEVIHPGMPLPAAINTRSRLA